MASISAGTSRGYCATHGNRASALDLSSIQGSPLRNGVYRKAPCRRSVIDRESRPSGRAQQLAARRTVSQILWRQETTAVKLRHAVAFGDEARDPDGIDLADGAAERRRESPT